MDNRLPANHLFRGIEVKFLKQKVTKYLNQPGKILDLGCGDGSIAKQVFNRQVDYGLDIDKRALQLAEEKDIYKKLLFAKAEDTPLKDNSIDLVFSNCTLEHIKNLEAVLAEVSRILKPSGVFAFTVPSKYYTEYNICTKIGFKPLTKFYGWLRNKKLTHFHLYSLKNWQKLLSDYDFKIFDQYYYHNLKAIAFWDVLFWLNPLFRLTGLHPKSIQKQIEKFITKAIPSQKQGASLFIAAKLNEQ